MVVRVPLVLSSDNPAIFGDILSKAEAESIFWSRWYVGGDQFLRYVLLWMGFAVWGLFEGDGERDIGKIRSSA